MEEETAFMTFEGMVPVETFQEDNVIGNHEDGLIPQARTTESEEDSNTDEDPEGSDNELSLPYWSREHRKKMEKKAMMIQIVKKKKKILIGILMMRIKF